MSNKAIRNIIIYAQNNDGKDGFDIYLGLSGKNEYLMTHRHNAYLYNILKDGISLDEFERRSQQAITDMVSRSHRVQLNGSSPKLRRRKNLSRKLENTFRHLSTVVNEYICYELEVA